VTTGEAPSRGAGAPRGAPPEKQNARARGSDRHHSIARRIKSSPWLPRLVFIAALLPLAWVVYAFLSDIFTGTRYLGSNPIKEAEHFTGRWVLRFLILSLSITPAVRLLEQGWLVRYRRTFGLFAFAYACVHLLIYFVLDVELTWSELVADIIKRKYITIGMTALLLLIPLAVTSTKGWIRRLGNKRWNAIHRLAYISVVLGTIHFYMAVKRDVRDPIAYMIVVAALLGWRIWRRRRPAVSQPAAARAA
jgi:sulfoxide reductase heme-binding subunit YedZ